MTTARLIIDTDPALGVVHDGRPRDVDDAFAIAEALRAPELDVVGITVTFGNAPLSAAVEVADRVVHLAGADVPIAAGQARSLPETGPPPATEATALLHDLLAEGPARIAALGPLGNLGALLIEHPEDAERIEEVVIVGGRSAGKQFFLGDVGPVRDFNFENDVRGARVLLEAGVPVVCAGFELSSPIAMTGEHLDAIAAHGTPLAEVLASEARPWLEFWTGQFPADAGFHPWDSAAICWLRSPELLMAEQRGFRIRTVRVEPSAGNPDATPTEVPWLETSTELPGELTFLTGFVPGGADRFLAEVVRSSR